MNPYHSEPLCDLYLGDARQILAEMPEESVNCVVTDPPYELGFMGKEWDKKGVSFQPETWKVILNACKPGAHMLCFGGTRTFHRIACAIEDAGWEIRDTVMWVYGSGFPKSLDVSKAIDKMAGAEREVVGHREMLGYPDGDGIAILNNATTGWGGARQNSMIITAPATPEAKQWDGWGTGLKPAWEPIILARKPLEKGLTVAENVLKYGTGALNIDRCRIQGMARKPGNRFMPPPSLKYAGGKGFYRHPENWQPFSQGRFPANLLHDGSDEVLAEFAKAGESKSNSHPRKRGSAFANGGFQTGIAEREMHDDTGTAARFFYCAKASRTERDAGLEGMPMIETQVTGWSGDGMPLRQDGTERKMPLARNNHPTVKPLALMRYLIMLITPPNGIILDPFMGSGSTLVATQQLGFRAIGIEIDENYMKLAIKRIGAAIAPLMPTTEKEG